MGEAKAEQGRATPPSYTVESTIPLFRFEADRFHFRFSFPLIESKEDSSFFLLFDLAPH
jgi:hypothetical protein